MTNPEIAGYAGAILGTLGGIVGTLVSIFNARRGKERRFVVWMALFFWLWMLFFLFLQFRYKAPWVMIPFFVTLPFVIRYSNKKAATLRHNGSEEPKG